MTTQADNRLTLVPAIGVYNTPANGATIRGKAGVTASSTTCQPEPGPGERSHGMWLATGTELDVTVSTGDYGPRSGENIEYKRTTVAHGRHSIMVTDTALAAVVEGRSGWGLVGGKKAGRILVWKWNLVDVDELKVVRARKYRKWWDAGLSVECANPFARLNYNGFGDAADLFMAKDSQAKATKADGSDLLGFARTIVAVAAALGRSVEHDNGDDGEIATFTYKFAGGPTTAPASRAPRPVAASSSWAAPQASAASVTAPQAAAAWLADPTERHELRYWDGGRWSEHVADRGVQGTDPV